MEYEFIIRYLNASFIMSGKSVHIWHKISPLFDICSCIVPSFISIEKLSIELSLYAACPEI